MPVYFIGSADLMPRNLDRRVEVIAPIESPEHQERLQEVLDVNLADDVLAWELDPDGVWRKVPTDRGHRRAAAHVRAGPAAGEARTRA